MINLVPPQGKKLVHREYVMRVGAVAACVSALVFAVSATALIPTYVLFLGSGAPEVTQNAATGSSAEEYEALTKTLRTSMALATQLGKPSTGLSVSQIVSHMEQPLTSEVVLEGMHFSQDAKQVRVEAVGTADTRESLQTFIAALKKDPFFSDAQIPVSDLARDTNLFFTLTLTLHSQ